MPKLPIIRAVRQAGWELLSSSHANTYIIHHTSYIYQYQKCGWADLTSSIDQLGRAADKCWLMLLLRSAESCTSADSCYGYVSTETQSSTQFHGVGGWEKKQLWSQEVDAAWVGLGKRTLKVDVLRASHGLSRFATDIAGLPITFQTGCIVTAGPAPWKGLVQV